MAGGTTPKMPERWGVRLRFGAMNSPAHTNANADRIV